MGIIRAKDFSMRYTVESAQPLTFFGEMSENGNHVTYPYGDSIVDVRQKKEILRYSATRGLTDPHLRNEIERRFGLLDDLQGIYERIGTDGFIAESISRYRGMRVTQNDPWETTLCFVISQFNNVKRIRGIVRRLMNEYGEEHTTTVEGNEMRFRSFPKPEVIAARSIKDLMKCGTGFRAKYIKGVAEACSTSFDLSKLYRKDYNEAKEELLTLPGIGDKVADCILLMGYKKLEAFPIDTWIKRVVERIYFKGRGRSVKRIHEFAERRFGECAGYAQQYLYWHGRSIRLS